MIGVLFKDVGWGGRDAWFPVKLIVDVEFIRFPAWFDVFVVFKRGGRLGVFKVWFVWLVFVIVVLDWLITIWARFCWLSDWVELPEFSFVIGVTRMVWLLTWTALWTQLLPIKTKPETHYTQSPLESVLLQLIGEETFILGVVGVTIVIGFGAVSDWFNGIFRGKIIFVELFAVAAQVLLSSWYPGMHPEQFPELYIKQLLTILLQVPL